ncbi:hypothetical protein GCM10027285_17820 [Oleiagrimonas citrea]
MHIRTWLVMAACAVSFLGSAHAAQHRFTVKDDIRIATFGDYPVPPITWSPDRSKAAVYVERGQLEQNKVEGILRIYSTRALKKWITGPKSAVPPTPLWTIAMAPYKEGPAMSNIRWTPDSRALTFLKFVHGKHRLVYADLSGKRLQILSLPGQDVTAADIHDRHHYVYAARDPKIYKPRARQTGSEDVTGRPLFTIVYPVDKYPQQAKFYERSELWAARGGAPTRLEDPNSGKPLYIFGEGQRDLSLSPDGNWLLTALPVRNVPVAWEQWPVVLKTYSVHGGPQDLGPLSLNQRLVSRYALINLKTGAQRFPSKAPTGFSATWFTLVQPAWSPDSRRVLLPDQFLFGADGSITRNPPCVALARVDHAGVSCIEHLKPLYVDGKPARKESLKHLRFGGPDNREILIDVERLHVRDHRNVTRRYMPHGQHDWTLLTAKTGHDATDSDTLKLSIRQRYDLPPKLVATDTANHRSRIVWDPNPQLANVTLNPISIFHWKLPNGHVMTGGLFKPADYLPGKRYPLVIQTHGFHIGKFSPSGVYTTAFAAQELAAQGFIVLQTNSCPEILTPDEAPCQARSYDAAIDKLQRLKWIDPQRIGIVGFSRTCYYVLEALTRGKHHYATATITDGVNAGYWQYMLSLDAFGNSTSREDDTLNQAAPFGKGLQKWLKNAPTFHMDKVTTPLLVVGTEASGVEFLWEPYAALRYLHKPVAMNLLHSDEHENTQPAARMASQGGTVDWMRFWLQGHEDPAPEKRAQYRRWEHLCDMQRAQHPEDPSFCVKSPASIPTSDTAASHVSKQGTHTRT